MADTRWRNRSWWTAIAKRGAIAFPIRELLHELGHFGGFAAFEFSGSRGPRSSH